MGQSGSWGLAAKVGGKNSLDAVKQWFLSGIVTKDEYEILYVKNVIVRLKVMIGIELKLFININIDWRGVIDSSLIAEGLLCPFKSIEYRLLLT